MIASIKKPDLLPALQLAASIAERKGTMPILANVLLRTRGKAELLVAASNMEQTLIASIPADIAAEGDLTVGAVQALDIVKALPGESVKFQRGDNNYLNAFAGKASYKLVGLAGKDFPNLPNPKEVKFREVDAQALAESFKRVAFSTSTDTTRAHLNGAHINPNTGEWASTDGHRLTVLTPGIVVHDGLGITVTRGAISHILKLAEAAKGMVKVGVTQRYIFVQIDKITLACKILDAVFPPYDQVIPKESAREFIVHRATLAETLRRVSVLATDKTGGVKITLGDGVLIVAVDNPDMGEARDELEIDYRGAPLSIGVNGRYLLDWLDACPTAEVRVGLNGDIDPLTLQAVYKDDAPGTSYLGVIMPMRI